MIKNMLPSSAVVCTMPTAAEFLAPCGLRRKKESRLLIRIAIRKRADALEDYCRRDITRGTNGLAPRWIGSLAPRFGLDGRVPMPSQEASVAFSNLVRGRSPGGVPLLASALPESRIRRRVGYDLVVAAPKSIAIAALVLGDEQVLDAHRQATETLLEELELRARSHHRNCSHPTRNLLGTEFVHTRSRENDPHLHSHLVLFNLTRVEPHLLPKTSPCPWKSLDPVRMFSDSVLLDYIYKSELAFLLRTQGFPITVVRNSPEIALIDGPQRKAFSTAQARINELEPQIFGTVGNDWARCKINDRFRRSKTNAEEELDLSQLSELWRQRMSAQDRDRLMEAFAQLQHSRIQDMRRTDPQSLGPYLRDAVRLARRTAREETLFVRPKLVWKKLFPLVMGLGPWRELKPMLGQALADSAHNSAGSSTGELIAHRLEMARRQLLFDRITRGQSVADLIPVQQIEIDSEEEHERTQKPAQPPARGRAL